jgi:hypothetical protein
VVICDRTGIAGTADDKPETAEPFLIAPEHPCMGGNVSKTVLPPNKLGPHHEQGHDVFQKHPVVQRAEASPACCSVKYGWHVRAGWVVIETDSHQRHLEDKPQPTFKTPFESLTIARRQQETGSAELSGCADQCHQILVCQGDTVTKESAPVE